MKKTLSLLLGVIQTFVAVGAMPAGLSMIIDPSGKGFGLPIDALNNSPFEDYLIPGIFLFVIFGLAHIVSAILSFRRNKNTGVIGITCGIILLIWICVQFFLIGFIEFLQPTFFSIGLIEIILSYLLIQETKTLTSS